MLIWAVHDGGYDEDTWYWGALVMLALLTAVVIARGIARDARLARRPGRARRVRAVRGLVVSVDQLGRVARGRAHRQQPGAALPARVRDHARAALDGPGRADRAADVRARRRGDGDRPAVPARVRRPRRRPRHLRPSRGADRLLQLDRGAVHDRGTHRDRTRRPARASRALRGRADRLRLRGTPACRDRPEPRLAVHAAAGRDRRDRRPPGPVARGGHRGLARRGRTRARAPAPGRLSEHVGPRAQPRRRQGGTRGARDLRGRVLRGHAARLGRLACPSSAAERGAAPLAWNDHDRARGRGCRRWRTRGNARSIRSGSSSGSGMASVTRRPRRRGRTSPTSAAGGTTSGGSLWMRSWPIRSAGSGRTTSTTTTCPAGGRSRSPRIPTVSSCGCSRTPGWWGSRCSRSSSWPRSPPQCQPAGARGSRRSSPARRCCRSWSG